MGRPARFDREQIAAAALRIAADRGPRAVTVGALADALGAPTGSIYHRFASRDLLLAELWMDTVEGFQDRFVAALDAAHDHEGAVAAAGVMAAWVREHMLEARLLLLHRKEDFVAGGWPEALAQRAAALDGQMGRALRAYATSSLGDAGRDAIARLRLALLDVPYGALRPYVQAGKAPPAVLDRWVARAVRAVLEGDDR